MSQIESVKIPLSFVRAYLKAKGWRETWNCYCRCGVSSPEDHDFDKSEHPIRFLYDHASQGHKPSFNMCHTWNRSIGSPSLLRPNFELWYGWWIATWNPDKNKFDVELDEKGSV